MNDQPNQSGQLSNSQDGCQTNSRRYDSFTTGPVGSAIPSNSWASYYNIVTASSTLTGLYPRKGAKQKRCYPYGLLNSTNSDQALSNATV